MGCCCACNIVCVSIISCVLSAPLLAPFILSNINIPTNNIMVDTNITNNTVSDSSISLLQTGLSWLHLITDNSDLDQTSRQELDSFIDALIGSVEQSSLVTLSVGCVNISTNILLIIGSCCKLRYFEGKCIITNRTLACKNMIIFSTFRISKINF